MNIFGLSNIQNSYGMIIGENITNITQNRKFIQIFCSIERINDLGIANQKNSFFTSIYP